MYRVRTARCACCDLDLDIAVAADATRPDAVGADASPVCRRCESHGPYARPGESDAHHAAAYRDALETSRDETSLARGERDFYRDRSITVSKRGETLVRALTRIDDLHHGLRGVCSCGQRDCEVRAVLADPVVARLIGTYDEELHTLYELQRENPDAGGDEWDYVDVTLVHPPREQRPAGRHRALG